MPAVDGGLLLASVFMSVFMREAVEWLCYPFASVDTLYSM